MYLLDYLLD